MKNRQLLLFTIVLAITLAGFVACEGPTGSTGPEGSRGPQGEQGPKGDQGDQGDEGTANVFYSKWLDLEWDRDEDNVKNMNIIEPRITESFMSRGTALMYLKLIETGGNRVQLLPYLADNGQRHNYYMRTEGYYNNLAPDAYPDETGLTFYILKENGVIFEGYLESIRYVLIPGGLPAKIPPGFWDDYEAVAKYYGIPD